MAYQPQVIRIPERLTPPNFQRGKLLKSLKESASVKPKQPATPRVNDVVKTLAAQLAELTKKVEMLKANQPQSIFDGCFSHGPREIPVEKSVESSVFDGAFSPRDLTPIVKAAEKEGFFPFRLTHEPKEKSVVIKSSTLCPWYHEEVKVHLSKAGGPDMDIFAGAFARA